MVHLVNTSGYYFIFQYFIERSDEQVTEQLDNNQYNDADLMEIKLALHLPYMSSSAYERIEGEIEIEDIHYNYVKRKVSNDTLYLLCLPNREKTKLVEDLNDYSGQAADHPAGSNETNSPGKKVQPLNEYNSSITAFNFQYTVQPGRVSTYLLTPALTSPFIDSSFHPPDTYSA